jgi:hypothetical protein
VVEGDLLQLGRQLREALGLVEDGNDETEEVLIPFRGIFLNEYRRGSNSTAQSVYAKPR